MGEIVLPPSLVLNRPLAANCQSCIHRSSPHMVAITAGEQMASANGCPCHDGPCVDHGASLASARLHADAAHAETAHAHASIAVEGPTLRILDHHLAALGGDHDGGRVGVARGDGRHHRGIDHPQAFKPMHPQPFIHHRKRIAGQPILAVPTGWKMVVPISPAAWISSASPSRQRARTEFLRRYCASAAGASAAASGAGNRRRCGGPRRWKDSWARSPAARPSRPR